MFNFPMKKDLKNSSLPNTEMSLDSRVKANKYYIEFIAQRVEMCSEIDKNEAIIDGDSIFYVMKKMLWDEIKIEEKREWVIVSKGLKEEINRLSDVNVKLKNFKGDTHMIISW